MSRNLIIRSSISVGICLLFGFIASLAMQTGYTDWYPQLDKPLFNLPEWIFGPVWLLMYPFMGIAAGIVWHKGFYHKWVKVALYHFGFQLLLNAFWSILFFGLHRPFWALLDIIALFILVLITIKWFKIISDRAAYLMVPYAVWVLFAAIINFEIWRLNYL
ncbi:TspO/MBR family protein [Autumnicola edwardsiae]|uniref:TspO/MBR family protein n=1 Tax=Autumnicola edwardsiae TaxID=3075594 RepID=A0ABU3CUQ6_9FLAO|nr:TspO/MBR family protein [Zunongwangia sp. F297]MDT0650102.1 TspO/MBR family protein [Zunongwangia sp. F297]